MYNRIKFRVRLEHILLAVLLAVAVLDRTEQPAGASWVQWAAVGAATLLTVAATWLRRRRQGLRTTTGQELDRLTGLYAHRTINGLLREAMRQAKRRRQELAVILLDIDDFSRVNDQYGFEVGDRVLHHVVTHLHQIKRSGDCAGRYGGDEFLLVLPRTTRREAEELAEQLQTALRQTAFRFHEYDEALPVTVSAGIALYPRDGERPVSLLEAVHEALRRAKRAGTAKGHVTYGLGAYEPYRATSEALETYLRALRDKDPYTLQHSEDVARYAVQMAVALALPPHMQRELRSAGMFHDIGKVLIPDQILKKPGRLDDGEYVAMRRHVEISDHILAPHYTSETMKQAVVCHHERFDGTGYPLGLTGTEIPLVGRILAIADAYSAMTLDRSYRKCKTMEEGLAEVRRCAHTQFDPELVEVFCRLLEQERAATASTA